MCVVLVFSGTCVTFVTLAKNPDVFTANRVSFPKRKPLTDRRRVTTSFHAKQEKKKGIKPQRVGMKVFVAGIKVE